MDLVLGTFQAVATLLVVGVIGFWVISRRTLAVDVLRFLSPLALEIGFPCLVFAKIVRQFSPEEYPFWWSLPLIWAAFTLIALALSWVWGWASERGVRREFRLALFYQNATFFPLVILTELYGPDSPFLINLFFFTIPFAPFVFTSYRFFFGVRLNREGMAKLIHPVTAAVIIALVSKLTGAHALIPEFVLRALEFVGNMTVPLLMLILGGNIYVDFKNRGRIRLVETAKFVLVKNFIFPLIALGVLAVIRPAYPIAVLLILQAAAPPITSVPVLVERERGDRAVVSQLLVGSFLASAVSIPLMFWIFSRIMPGG